MRVLPLERKANRAGRLKEQTNTMRRNSSFFSHPTTQITAASSGRALAAQPIHAARRLRAWPSLPAPPRSSSPSSQWRAGS